MRAQSPWRRIGLALATLSLALFAFVVAPHVHAAGDNPKACPIWAAHGPAGAAVEAPPVVVATPDVAPIASDPTPQGDVAFARAVAPFAARAPPFPIA